MGTRSTATMTSKTASTPTTVPRFVFPRHPVTSNARMATVLAMLPAQTPLTPTLFPLTVLALRRCLSVMDSAVVSLMVAVLRPPPPAVSVRMRPSATLAKLFAVSLVAALVKDGNVSIPRGTSSHVRFSLYLLLGGYKY